jgi:hypothetical protein
LENLQDTLAGMQDRDEGVLADLEKFFVNGDLERAKDYLEVQDRLFARARQIENLIAFKEKLFS